MEKFLKAKKRKWNETNIENESKKQKLSSDPSPNIDKDLETLCVAYKALLELSTPFEIQIIDENQDEKLSLQAKILNGCKTICQKLIEELQQFKPQINEFSKLTESNKPSYQITLISLDPDILDSISFHVSPNKPSMNISFGRELLKGKEDKKISRVQGELLSQLKNRKLEMFLKQVGRNPMFLWRQEEGTPQMLLKDQEYELKNDYVFSLCASDYRFKVAYKLLSSSSFQHYPPFLKNFIEIFEFCSSLINISRDLFVTKMLFTTCQYSFQKFKECKDKLEETTQNLFLHALLSLSLHCLTIQIKKKNPFRRFGDRVNIPCICDECKRLKNWLYSKNSTTQISFTVNNQKRLHLHHIIDDPRTQTACGPLEHFSSGEGKERALVLQKQLSLDEFEKKKMEETNFLESYGMYYKTIPDFISEILSLIPEISFEDLKLRLVEEKGVFEKDLSILDSFNLKGWIEQINYKVPDYSDFYMCETADRPQSKALFFFDIEHCGGTIDQSAILSIGCCEVISGKWFYSAVNPGSEEKLKTYTSHIHRLSVDQLCQAPTWTVVGKSFSHYIQSFQTENIVMVHHSRSNVDESYLKSENAKHRIETPSSWKFFNTMKFVEELYPELSTSNGGCGYSISALAKREQIGQKKKHDAKLDTQTTWAVLKSLLQKKFPNKDPVEVLFQTAISEEEKPLKKKKKKLEKKIE